jgi:hypothetical protein
VREKKGFLRENAGAARIYEKNVEKSEKKM